MEGPKNSETPENSDFDTKKAESLESGKDDWDENVVPLCDAINNNPNFYTSSSCAGRVVLLQIPGIGDRSDAKWLFTSHGDADPNKVLKTLKEPPKEQVVYRYEPFIIHVECRNLEHAERLLTEVRTLGLKRCGIISLGAHPTVEILGTANISTLISQENKLLLTEEYIKLMVETSNMLLEGNWNLLNIMTNLAKKAL